VEGDIDMKAFYCPLHWHWHRLAIIALSHASFACSSLMLFDDRLIGLIGLTTD